jgi:hypothetical protein
MSHPKAPDFFVIGAGRSGTTSLHGYVSQHSQLFLAPKNPSYFYACDLGGSGFEHDPAALPSYFLSDATRYQPLFAQAPAGTLTGDVSPVYLASTRVAGRIARHNPGAKLITLLRNPVDRVFSHYVARHRDGLEHTPTFEKLVDVETREAIVRSDANASYLPGGMTSHFLQPYFDVFPRDQIVIHFYEDFATDTGAVMRDLCRFLGARDDFPFDVSQIHNHGGGRIQNRTLGKVWAASEPLRRGLRPLLPKKWRDGAFRQVTSRTERVTVRPETRQRLIELYRGDIAQLKKMTGRNLAAWLS